MNKKYYETSDRNIASVLKCFFPLESITDDQGKKIWIFEQTTELEEIKKLYWQGILTVNAVQLIAAQEFIKNTIYNH